MERVTGLGTTVRVKVYDENGWLRDSGTWSPEYGHHSRDESLPVFLSSFVGLPEAEANELAASIQTEWRAEWRARGGESHDRFVNRFAITAIVALAALFLLAIVGVILLVWVLL